MPDIAQPPPAADNPEDVPTPFVEITTTGTEAPPVPDADQTPYADEGLPA